MNQYGHWRLKVILDLMGLNQADLARTIGISRQAVNEAICRPAQSVKLQTKRRIVEALKQNITVDRVFDSVPSIGAHRYTKE